MSFNERIAIKPASHTKDVSLLQYPLNPLDPIWHNVNLHQLQALTTTYSNTSAADEQTTGTTLWLSAQLLTLHLLDTYGDGVAARKPDKQRKARQKLRQKKLRAVELGAGIGLTSLVLASLGIDVVATDLPVVIDQVLGKNINDNRHVVDVAVSRRNDMYQFAVTNNELGLEAGRIDVKVLDWKADVTTWLWDLEGWISPSTLPKPPPKTQGVSHIPPPFDLIVTSDTIYTQELILPLFRTLYHLSIVGQPTPASAAHTKKNPYPPVLLSLERRDSDIVDRALQQARQMGFECQMIRARKIAKLMKKARAFCPGEVVQDPENSGHDSDPDFQAGPIMQSHSALGEWDGVEIWKLQLKPSMIVNTGALGL